MFKEYKSKVLSPTSFDTYVGLYPMWIGYLKSLPNYECKPRVLDDYFMIYTAKGKGILRCEKKHYKLKEGDLFFLFPGVVHYYATDPQNPIELWWIGFNGPNCNKILSTLKISSSNPILSLGTLQEDIFKNIQEIYYNMEEFSIGSKLKSCGNLYSIFGFLIDNTKLANSCNTKNSFSKSIEKSLAYIEANYSNQISIKKIAEYAGLTRTYFATRFKKEVECTPQEYLTKIRLKQSKYYLTNSNLSITEVAHSTGFQDPLYFSKVFSKFFGCSPTDFRIKSKTVKKYNENNSKSSL